jgi:hypothetical protein
LLKTFCFGILLGVAVAAGALYAVPVVDQAREVSIVAVAPNGGNSEAFHINIPTDRIMFGAPGRESGVPPKMTWPQDEIFANVRTEVFKIRNVRDAVIGVAARSVAGEGTDETTDWVLHLPARGSLFVNMEAKSLDAGPRIGQLRAGSREFDDLNGLVAESWVKDTGEEGENEGRIELLATYISTVAPQALYVADPDE